MQFHKNIPPNGRNCRLVVLGVLLTGIIAGFGSAVVGSGTAGATTAATYSASTTQSGQLPEVFAASAGSDGWALAITSTQVFNVTHHQPVLEVTCHNQSDGSACWNSSSTKIVSDGIHNFATPIGAGIHLDQATGHLYVFVAETDGNPADTTAGVACINTTLPKSSTGRQLFCGFTPLSAAGDAPIVVYPGLTSPVLVGNSWYAFNEVGGVGSATGSGTKNTLLCFDVATGSACPTKSYPVNLSGTVAEAFGAPAPIGQSGGDIFVPVAASASGTTITELGCFNAVARTACSGSWPISIPAIAGAPFPLLDGSGTAIGVCLPIQDDPCFTFTGASTPTPAILPLAIGVNDKANGESLTLGSRVYVPNFKTRAVDCFDFSTSRSCANFPLAMRGLSLLYTVNPDPFRPSCIWVNSDSGKGQIQSFDAFTGGACAPGPIRLQAASVVDSAAACQPSDYTSIQLTSPARATYSSGSVQVADARGKVLTGFPVRPVNAFGLADLSGLDFSGVPLPQFVVTLTGQTSFPEFVSLRLSWHSQSSPACTSEGQTASTTPGYWLTASDGGIFAYGNAGFYGSTGNIHLNRPITGMAPNPSRSGYWLVAKDGGIFAFGVAGFHGSTGNIHLNKPVVGMAVTPTGQGYWMVASDGGIFAFGDARFFGSAGNIQLNQPIVGMAPTPDGGGYWLVASDGGIFSYGDAQFYGSTGNIVLNKPVVGIAANPTGGGYWMVASDGGIFSFGTSGFFGSSGNIALNKPVVGMATTVDGLGYWLVASDGGIFNYGSAGFAGSAGNISLAKPVVGIAA